MMMARRFDGQGNGYDNTTRYSKQGVDWTGVVKTHENRLQQPLRWRKPRRVFVNSMSDLFHPAVPLTFIDKVFATMAMADCHVFQVLTKRPERMAEYMDAGKELWAERWPEAAETIADGDEAPTMHLMDFPPGNVWLGTSVEDDAVMDRADALRETTAAVRFLSLEPLLGPLPDINLKGIHWVIVGGESGPGARPINQKWVVDIRDQCRAQDVPFFFKQWGGVRKKENGRELEGRTWDEFPDEARETFAAE